MLDSILEFFKPKGQAQTYLPKKYLALDIEITKTIPEGASDWNVFRPFGISCAATINSDGVQKIWYGKTPKGEIGDQMSPADVGALIGYLSTEVIEGKTIVTWNGLSFDFDVLAEESRLYDVCKKLALGHIDMMFHVLCQNGYPLALDKALRGMGLAGKPVNINGSSAPKYWAEGQRKEVLQYVMKDAESTLNLFLVTEKRKQLSWLSNRNQRQYLLLPHGWLTVSKAINLPLPNTSWMQNPLPRNKFTAWLTAPERTNKQQRDAESWNTVTNNHSSSKTTLPKLYTYYFRHRSDLWWKIKSPIAEDEVAISQFLSTGYAMKGDDDKSSRMSTMDLSMREIALTFGGTNIMLSEGITLDEETSTIYEIENFLQELPREMVTEIWYQIGMKISGWGPDIEEIKKEEEGPRYDAVGLGDNIPIELEDPYDDYWMADEYQ